MDIALAIEKLLPAAKYEGSTVPNTEACYTALVWLDTRGKPPWVDIQTANASLPPYVSREEIHEQLVEDYEAATTASQKIVVLAKKLGLE